MYNHGFTLLELLITLIIVILLITIGVPSFSAQIHNTRVKTITSSLLESVELTRTQAVFSNTRATMKHHGTWEDGWDVFIDKNNNGTLDQDEKLLASTEKVNNVRITSNRPVKNYISYIGTGESRFVGKADGGAFQAGTLTVCPTTKGNGYELILARSGRMRMHEITADKCSVLL